MNEPAFPTPYVEENGSLGYQVVAVDKGITMRDYFAAQALIGLLSAGGDSDDGYKTMSGLVTVAYLYADTMLDRRGK